MKKEKRIIIIICIWLLVLGYSWQSHADLINRGTDSLGNRLIYDTDLDITWYDYMNPTTSDWFGQMNWAGDLTVNFGGTNYSDWYLAPAGCWLGIDGQVHCSNTVVGLNHLYYTELGNSYGSLTNTGPFMNLGGTVWTSTSDNPARAFYYNTDTGYSWMGSTYDWYLSGIAVRSGNVAVMPEPVSFLLFVAGGTFLAGRRYIRR